MFKASKIAFMQSFPKGLYALQNFSIFLCLEKLKKKKGKETGRISKPKSIIVKDTFFFNDSNNSFTSSSQIPRLAYGMKIVNHYFLGSSRREKKGKPRDNFVRE